MTLEQIRLAAKEGADPHLTVERLTAYIEAHEASEEAYIERGKTYWSLGERALTINDYLAAIKINPDGKGRQALDAVYSILDYYNKDLYNP